MPYSKVPLDGVGGPPPRRHLNVDHELVEARKAIVPLLIKEQRVTRGLVVGGITSLATACVMFLLIVARYGLPAPLAGVFIGCLAGAAARKAGRLIEKRYRFLVALEAAAGCAAFFALVWFVMFRKTVAKADERYVMLLLGLLTAAIAMAAAYALSLRRTTRGELIKRHMERT